MTRGRLALVLTATAAALAFPQAALAAGEFRLCREDRCGLLTVPLDHSGAVGGRLTLTVQHGFDLRGSDAVTLVLPSAPGAGSPDPYPWNELMPRDAVVTFDPRGTGRHPLRCRDLEAAAATDAAREAAACAALLGEKRRFFRASDTVEDIELLRQALGFERISIVGPGYGSYVAQRYALRYPQRVERLILTSVVDAAGMDPLFRDSVAAVPRVLEELCRSGCGPFTRDPVGDTRSLVAELAGGPLRGFIVGPRGQRRAVALSRQELLFALLAGDDNPIARPDYPGTVVSALRGDPAPLLRLKVRGVRISRFLPLRYLSRAAAAAATCEEVRFPWPWHASPAERVEAVARAEAEMDPAGAAPFDPHALVRSELMRLCGRWPTASPGPPPEPGPMPDVPVLVMTDPEELRTPLETAKRTAARFPRAKLLVAPDLSYFGECTERAVSRFMRGERVQDRCPREGPGLDPNAPAPTSLRDLDPVAGVSGRRGRLLSALAVSFGDLIDDFYAGFLINPDALGRDLEIRGGGLRGGSFVIDEESLRLRRYQFVPGVRISGAWGGGGGRDRSLPLRIDGPGRLNGRLHLLDSDEDLTFRVRGRIAGRRVRVRLHVPSRLVQAVEEEGGFARATALPWLP